MRVHWAAAFAAAAVAAATAGARGTHDGACELVRVDRAHTPSRTCMSCHDGSTGNAVGLPRRCLPGRLELGQSHPVEVEYARAAASNPSRYQPPSALPREVPLVDGRLECTTCHDGASRDPKRVAAVGDLCRACHVM